jgi:hypothetical protein
VGKQKEALRFARIVEESSRKRHGLRSLQHAVSLETLAQARAKNGKQVKAEPPLQEAISFMDEHGWRKSLFKARLLNLSATLHARLDDPEGAQRR